jgi:pimeloyl-ACP methyl ester carboxylesterase
LLCWCRKNINSAELLLKETCKNEDQALNYQYFYYNTSITGGAMKKALIVLLALVVLLFLLPLITGNLEEKQLDDQVRAELGLNFLQLSDGVVHYDLSGPEDGEVVVLVHGNAAPLFSWDNNVKALTDAGFRVIRYDLYGFGFSDRPDVHYSRALYDRQLYELLSELNIEGPVRLVGTSQGGSIAVEFTANHPEKVKRLALLSPFINVLPMKAMISLVRLPVVGDYIASIAFDRINLNYPEKVFADTEAIPPEFTERYREQLTYEGFKRARLSNLRGDSLSDFTSRYEKVAATGTPVLLTWGTADMVIMDDSIANIKAAIPGIAYHEIEGGGHLVHYENPESINTVLTEFLLEE